MDLQTFYRQANFLRDFEPELTSTTPGITFNTITVNAAKFLVLGRIVVGAIRVSFKVSGGDPYNVFFSTPTPVKQSSPSVLAAFSGFITSSSTPVGAFCLESGTQKMGIVQYDSGLIIIGAGTGYFGGFFFYENGEPIV